MKKVVILFCLMPFYFGVFSQVKTLTTDEFFSKIYDDENNFFINKYGTIIDLYATWCGPCRVMEPTFNGAASEYSSYFDFYRIDIDEEEELADFFQVKSIPMLIYIPVKENNSGYYSSNGVISKNALLDKIDRYIVKNSD
jgi:thiol-disulfide isomerase/thioredoxin